MKIAILLSFLIFFSPLFGEIQFHELKTFSEGSDQEIKRNLSHYDGQKVSVKGFLYETKEGKHILSSEPNLKSCCVGASAKVSQQIVVRGEFPPGPWRVPVVVQGVFAVEPLRDKDGKLIQLFKIDHAYVVEDTVEKTPIWSLAIIALLLCASWVIYRKQKYKL